MKKSAIEDGINYMSYFMGSMALRARDRLKVNEIVPRVGLHWIYNYDDYGDVGGGVAPRKTHFYS